MEKNGRIIFTMTARQRLKLLQWFKHERAAQITGYCTHHLIFSKKKLELVGNSQVIPRLSLLAAIYPILLENNIHSDYIIHTSWIHSNRLLDGCSPTEVQLSMCSWHAAAVYFYFHREVDSWCLIFKRLLLLYRSWHICALGKMPFSYQGSSNNW